MNPITLAGGLAALAVAGYALHVAYSAGQSNVQAKWDMDVIVRQKQLSEYKDRILDMRLDLDVVQKEVRDAHEREKVVAAKLIAAQRVRATDVDGRLRNASDKLTERLKANADDTAALRECKATVESFRSVFESCVGRYRELGEAAQQRVADAVSRGFECERSYDAAERSLKQFFDQSGVHLDQGVVK